MGMDVGLLGLLLFVGFFVVGFMWYLLGRTICLLILNDFVWEDFVADWKDFGSESIGETLVYMFFPFTILYFSLTSIKF
jgi:hypothetical protein